MQTVTFLAPTVGTDEYGNEALDYDDTTDTDVAGCFFAPGTPSELEEGHTGLLTGILYCPHGTVVASSMRVRISGDEWEVSGLPKVWNGFPGPSGVEVAVTRIQLAEGGS